MNEQFPVGPDSAEHQRHIDAETGESAPRDTSRKDASRNDFNYAAPRFSAAPPAPPAPPMPPPAPPMPPPAGNPPYPPAGRPPMRPPFTPERPPPFAPPTAPAAPPRGILLSPRVIAQMQETLDQMRDVRAELALLNLVTSDPTSRRRLSDLVALKDGNIELTEALFRDITGFRPLENAPEPPPPVSDARAAMRRAILNQRALTSKLTELARIFRSRAVYDRLAVIMENELQSLNVLNDMTI